MSRQIADRRTVGVPTDVARARREVAAMRDAAAASAALAAGEASRSALMRDAATSAAARAQASAESSALFASRATTVAVGASPPASPADGAVWLVVGSGGAVGAVAAWDGSDASGRLECGACECGAHAELGASGAWRFFGIAASAA